MKKLAMLLASFGLLTVFALPSTGVLAQENVLNPACQGFSPTDPNAPTLCRQNAKPEDPGGCNSIYGECGILTKALRILSTVIGIASVIVIIISGLKYIMSGGDSNSVNSAKNTLLYAVIGLVIAVMGQFLIIFVLSKI